MIPENITFDSMDYKLVLPSAFDVWRKRIYDSVNINPDDIVFDIGAGIGIYTIRAALKAKFVFAIELDPSNYKYLSKNIASNNQSNVRRFNTKLGFGANIKTLDMFVKQHNLKRIDVIKLSVASPKEIIIGGQESIRRFKPRIIVNLAHNAKTTIGTVTKSLDWLDYKMINKNQVLYAEYKLPEADKKYLALGLDKT